MTPHACQHERTTLAFNTVLRHSSDRQLQTLFAAHRPRDLFVPAPVQSMHLFTAFESPHFVLPAHHSARLFDPHTFKPATNIAAALGDGQCAGTDSDGKDTYCADDKVRDAARVVPRVAVSSPSRELLLQILRDRHCSWSSLLDTVVCHVQNVESARLDTTTTTTADATNLAFADGDGDDVRSFAAGVAGAVAGLTAAGNTSAAFRSFGQRFSLGTTPPTECV